MPSTAAPRATSPAPKAKNKRRGGTGKKSSGGGGGGEGDLTGGEHAQLIAQYHALNKYRESLDHDPTLTPADRAAKRRKLDRQLAELGGLEAYQQASLVGETAPEHKFNAGKWVVSELRAARAAESEKNSGAAEGKLRLLDVGAIKNQYLDHGAWLDVTAIDLNPQHPSVIKADFFEFSRECREPFDVAVLSLVINFVGDPRRKGEMLVRCQALVRDGGTLFIVLPLACVNNSRYMKHSRFVKMLKSLGFELTKSKTSAKLCFFVFRKLSAEERAQDGTMQPREFKRKLCRGGLGRNNFCIILAGPRGRRAAGRDDDEAEDSEGEQEGGDEEEEEDERPAKARRDDKKTKAKASNATNGRQALKRKQPPQRSTTAAAAAAAKKKTTTSPSADASGERAGKRQKTRSPAPPPQQRSGPSPRKSALARAALSPKERAQAVASLLRP